MYTIYNYICKQSSRLARPSKQEIRVNYMCTHTHTHVCVITEKAYQSRALAI